MVYIVCGIIVIICIIGMCVCLAKLAHKIELDKTAQLQYKKEVHELQEQKKSLNQEFEFYKKQIENEQQRFNKIQAENNSILAQQATELDEFYETNKQRKLEQLENEINQQEQLAKELLNNNLIRQTEEYQKESDLVKKALQDVISDCQQQSDELNQNLAYQQQRYNSLIAPLQQYEKDIQAKLYYTVQIPEEYREDIDYLLNTVTNKIQHPDVINKLIWAEYIRPNIENTFKRVGIEGKPGIYKITNIYTGKSYIGKSTDIKKRISDHFKGAIGISSIADQEIHHAILKEGLWNWSIEPIIYCEKEKLSELEKYYIDFFKTQEFGYNMKAGG